VELLEHRHLLAAGGVDSVDEMVALVDDHLGVDL